MKPPFRLAIASFFLDGHHLGAEEVLDRMQPVYETEKQFTHKNVESDLLALKAVGILKPSEAHNDKYIISEYGKEKVGRAL